MLSKDADHPLQPGHVYDTRTGRRVIRGLGGLRTTELTLELIMRPEEHGQQSRGRSEKYGTSEHPTAEEHHKKNNKHTAEVGECLVPAGRCQAGIFVVSKLRPPHFSEGEEKKDVCGLYLLGPFSWRSVR